MASVGKVGRAFDRGDAIEQTLRKAALGIAFVALVFGAVAVAVEPKFGLFATAFVLGGTQLVGL